MGQKEQRRREVSDTPGIFSACPKCYDPIVFHCARHILEIRPVEFGTIAEIRHPPNRRPRVWRNGARRSGKAYSARGGE